MKLKKYKFFHFLLKRKLGFIPDTEIAFTHLSLQDLVKSPFKHSKKKNWFYSDIRFFKSRKLVNKTHNQIKACDITVFVSKATLQITEVYSKMIIDNAI